MFDNHNLHKVWYYDLQTICTWTWWQTQSKLTQTSVLKMVCCTPVIHRSSAGRGAEYLQTGCPRSDPLRVFSLSALNELAWILTSQAGSALIGHRVIGEKGGGLRTEHKKCHVCFTAFLFFYYSLRNAYIYLSWYCCINVLLYQFVKYVLLREIQPIKAGLKQVFNKSLYNTTAHYITNIWLWLANRLPAKDKPCRLWLNIERHSKKYYNALGSGKPDFKASVTAWNGRFVWIMKLVYECIQPVLKLEAVAPWGAQDGSRAATEFVAFYKI